MYNIIFQEKIRTKIIEIKGQRVILDRDLAELYGVETRLLNQAVKRNIERFPIDFMFQLSGDELKNWMSQIVISNKERMGIRKMPYVFTEQGVAMLSSVLRSKKAIEINIVIMRVFVMVARIIDSSRTLTERIIEIEDKYKEHDKKFQINNKNVKEIFNTIKY